MRGEDMYEDGIVTATGSGNATVTVMKSDNCGECRAKIICGIGEGTNENSVEVTDPFGVRIGDSVRIVIRGESLFAASGLLYGIPLLLFIAGMLFGFYVYEPGGLPRELWAFGLGTGLTALYYLVIFVNNESLRRKAFMPSIVFVHQGLPEAQDLE
jgi:positive regulator of sigma E activity